MTGSGNKPILLLFYSSQTSSFNKFSISHLLMGPGVVACQLLLCYFKRSDRKVKLYPNVQRTVAPKVEWG